MTFNQQFSRRTFSAVACAASASLLARQSLVAASTNALGNIDAHVHVWSPDTRKYPLDSKFSNADMQPLSFTAQQLFEHCKPHGVTRIVLIQMSFYGYDHRYMSEVMHDHPGVFSGVALIDYQAKDVVDRMRELATRGMRGFRLHSHGDAEQWVASESMAKLWKAAGESGLAICPLINPADIPYVASLASKHSETTVVVDHFARVGITGTIEPKQLDDLCNLAKLPNVYVKTSAFYALGKKQAPYEDLKPMIRRVVDAFGPERLMWASDCPFQVEGGHTYADSIGLIRDRIDFLSDTDKDWLLHKTADKVFFAI
jgi:predicted TIM-barrel fold metal-dependent hydrolase